MEELRVAELQSGSSTHVVDGCNMAPAIAAAAAMQCYTSEASCSKAECDLDGSGDVLNPADYGSDVGTLARVVFRFQHRPEWLMQGSRVIMRDRTDGCTAGAGVIQLLHTSRDPELASA